MTEDAIAFVGAYERDNFGDLLFPWITRQLIPDTPTILLSPFDGQADHLLGEQVESHVDALRLASYRSVWSVGGEVGGATPRTAAAYLHNPVEPDALAALESPYLPRMSRNWNTLPIPFVITSIGLTADMQGTSELRLVQALAEADFISVRDPKSSKKLESYGLEHSLTPDFVAMLAEYHPRPRRQGHIALQLNVETLDRLGIERAATFISAAIPTEDDIVIFAAGTAPGHDSTSLLNSLSLTIARHRLGIPGPMGAVSVDLSRDPLAIVDIIASARLLIATSLHCRIVAAAFDVPRVSVENAKVSMYAQHWDPTWPYAVPMQNLPSAVARQGDSQVGADLSRLVRPAAEQASATAMLSASDMRSQRRLERLDATSVSEGLYIEELRERLDRAERGLIPLHAAAKGQLRRLKHTLASRYTRKA